MTIATKEIQELLAQNGIKASVKKCVGSMRGYFRLYAKGQTWADKTLLHAVMNEMGFRGLDGKLLDRHSGNGGEFHVFTLAPQA